MGKGKLAPQPPYQVLPYLNVNILQRGWRRIKNHSLWFNTLSFQTFRTEAGIHQSILKSEAGLGHQNRVLIKGVSPNQGCPSREGAPHLKCKHIHRDQALSFKLLLHSFFFSTIYDWVYWCNKEFCYEKWFWSLEAHQSGTSIREILELQSEKRQESVKFKQAKDKNLKSPRWKAEGKKFKIQLVTR